MAPHVAHFLMCPATSSYPNTTHSTPYENSCITITKAWFHKASSAVHWAPCKMSTDRILCTCASTICAIIWHSYLARVLSWQITVHGPMNLIISIIIPNKSYTQIKKIEYKIKPEWITFNRCQNSSSNISSKCSVNHILSLGEIEINNPHIELWFVAFIAHYISPAIYNNIFEKFPFFSVILAKNFKFDQIFLWQNMTSNSQKSINLEQTNLSLKIFELFWIYSPIISEFSDLP